MMVNQAPTRSLRLLVFVAGIPTGVACGGDYGRCGQGYFFVILGKRLVQKYSKKESILLRPTKYWITLNQHKLGLAKTNLGKGNLYKAYHA